MTETFLRSYYFSLLAVVFITPYSIFNRSLGDPDYIWVLSIVSDSFSPLALGTILFISSVVTTILNLIISNALLRFVTFLSFLSLLSFKYSFGKIDHIYHIWIVSSFFFVFYDYLKPINSQQNKLVLRIIQSWLLMQYFAAGLWKLISNKMLFTFDGITKTSLEHIAYAVAEKDLPIAGLRSLLVYEYSWLAGIGFIMVLTFQLLCSLCGFLGRGYTFCGIIAVVFHSTTGFVLGIWYWGTSIAAVFFLIYAERLIIEASEGNSVQAK